MTPRIIQNKIIKHLKNDISFEGMITAEEVNGTNFSAIDIALAESKKKVHVFRIVVVKHAK